MKRIHLSLLAVCAALVMGGASLGAADKSGKAREGMVPRADLEIVECLLPGQVRQLGNSTYLTQRRPIRTTLSDCVIRGGEHVLYDRADSKTALRYWMEAAQAGDAEAQNNVGAIYERGLGGEPNYEAAVVWYQKAADSGNSRAQFNLGTLYEQGLGVPQDKLKALNLYRRAWGIAEDNLMYADVAKREQDKLRDELEKTLAEKDQQLKLLQKQIQQMENDAKKRGAQTSPDSAKEIEALRNWIAKLEAERRSGQGQLQALGPATRDAATRAPVAPLDPAAQVRLAKGLKFGRYYALIIGNQNYQILESLKTPRTDAERTAKILKEKYGFTVQVIEDANDVAMLRALNELNRVLRPDDNLLIYYAGHGTRLQTGRTEIGYWMPVNSERPPNDTFWVPNEQISAHLQLLPARRVLVVADSCYAGLLSQDPGVNLFGTESQITVDYLKYKLPKRSRLLLASGGDEPVLDEGGQGNSVFARAFLEVLGSNEGVLSTPALFAKVQERVKAAAGRSGANQTPQFKAIRTAGHEMGDFFFLPDNPRL